MLSDWLLSFEVIFGGGHRKGEQRVSDGSLCTAGSCKLVLRIDIARKTTQVKWCIVEAIFKSLFFISSPPFFFNLLILMLHSVRSFLRIIINIYQRSFSAALTEGQIIQRPLEVQLHFSAVSQRKVGSKSPLCTLPEVLLYWSPPENVVWTFSHVHHLALRFGSCSKHKYILFFMLYFWRELVPAVTYSSLSCGSAAGHPREEPSLSTAVTLQNSLILWVIETVHYNTTLLSTTCTHFSVPKFKWHYSPESSFLSDKQRKASHLIYLGRSGFCNMK